MCFPAQWECAPTRSNGGIVGIEINYIEALGHPQQSALCLCDRSDCLIKNFSPPSPPGRIGDVRQGGSILQDRHRLAGILNAPSQGAVNHSVMPPCSQKCCQPCQTHSRTCCPAVIMLPCCDAIVSSCCHAAVRTRLISRLG